MDKKQRKNVHYFPGHMKKTLGEMERYVSTVDIVIELADARCPLSSRNPMLTKYINNKPHLLCLTKTDLADPKLTSAWTNYFEEHGLDTISVNLKKERVLPIIQKSCTKLAQKKREKEKKLGMKPQPIRLLIVGVPNVGKSTLINNLAGRTVAKAQNKPGCTRAEQWIKLPNSFILLDTPGVLPMNYPDQSQAVRLALTGSIKEEVLPVDALMIALLGYMKENYPTNLAKRYGISDLRDIETYEVLEKVAVSCGFLIKGGLEDTSKSAVYLLKEYQNGKLGNITLEDPKYVGSGKEI